MRARRLRRHEAVRVDRLSEIPFVCSDLHRVRRPDHRTVWLSRSLLAVWALAAAVRVLVFVGAENKQGDAPMRVLIAARMNAEPAAAGDARTFCQFGPLPIEVIRPFLKLDPDGRRGSRWPSLLAGIAVFPWLFALGRRMLGGGAPAVASRSARAPLQTAALALAGLALALSPLHIQASTTASSEALFLLLAVGAYERLAAALSTRRTRDFMVAGALFSLLAVTRFDAWIAAPVAAAGLWRWGERGGQDGRDGRARSHAGLFLALAATLPGAYLLWSRHDSGEAFFFARYITRDHAQLAAAAVARLGALGARGRQLAIWLISFTAVMTPLLLASAVSLLGSWRRQSPATRVILASVLAPFALYLTKGLVFGDFEPLPRFAIAPGVMLLPPATAALLEFLRRRARTPDDWVAQLRFPVSVVAAGALAINGLAVVLAFAPAWSGTGRIWTGAESIGPLTRLDAEDRAVAEYLRVHRRPTEAVFIDTWGYADIVIAHAAGIPIGRVATLAVTRTPAPTLAAARAATEASWFAYHDESWGRHTPPDWPAYGVRLGHWRVARFDGAAASPP